MERLVNLYKFVPLEDLTALRQEIFDKASSLNLKGTVLLGAEGLNVSCSGRPDDLTVFVKWLEQRPGVGDLDPKFSEHEGVSFRRLLVKIKKEIVTFGKEGLDPRHDAGEYIDAKTFKAWQEENRDFLLIDTRNDYEVAMGTFEKAVNPDIKSFREFSSWVEQLPAEDKKKTVVTFCTGGIRCEKATSYMKKAGFDDVRQLHGGILRYFEEVPGAPYWKGDCVVFDKRKAVTRDLKPAEGEICFVCLNRIETEPHAHPAGNACGRCDAKMKQSAEERLARGREKAALHRERRVAHCEQERRKHQSSSKAPAAEA